MLRPVFADELRLIANSREPRVCLDHVVVFGEGHRRHLLSCYHKCYNEVRRHLTLKKDAPVPSDVQRAGCMLSLPILGDLHPRCPIVYSDRSFNMPRFPEFTVPGEQFLVIAAMKPDHLSESEGLRAVPLDSCALILVYGTGKKAEDDRREHDKRKQVPGRGRDPRSHEP